MILQALKEYYDRKAADPESGIAPLGWERKELPFLLVLDTQGQLVNIEDTRTIDGKMKVAHPFVLPQSVKRSSGIAANLLWDNVEYVLGIPCKKPVKVERVKEAHTAFIQNLTPYAQVPAVAILLKLLGCEQNENDLARFAAFAEMKESNAFISFKIAGEKHPVFCDRDFKELYEKSLTESDSNEPLPRCLVTGEQDEVAVTHPSIKGVRGANTTGGNIVSFNYDSTCSFGKKQGHNATVGVRAAFAYTTALNTLLGKNSRQKIHVGDATTVFWSAKNCQLEEFFGGFFDDLETKDDPDALTSSVAALLTSVKSGSFVKDDAETKFYVLGLSPNAARISVRFWHVGTVAEMSGRFAEWFDDLTIAHGDKLKDHLSMYRLLCSIAAQGKAENTPPNLAGNTMRAILEGLPLPETLYHAALQRERLDHSEGWGFVSNQYARMKIIKACLNRKIRLQENQKERMLTVSLDNENPNLGYRLGRLFAVLERIQERANPGINATIRDKYYGSASAMPASVFGTLMRLKNHHLSKLENPGEKINLERLLGEIVNGIPPVMPAHLNATDQGSFAIGYYHQRQDFFTKKESTAETASNN